MSTYYFLLCEECGEWVEAASRAAGGPCQLGDSAELLPQFIVFHAPCGQLRIVNEHERHYTDEASNIWTTFVEWTVENAAQLSTRLLCDSFPSKMPSRPLEFG